MGTIRVNEDFYQNGYNPYKSLKPKAQSKVRNQSYIDIFENLFTEIWDIGGLPDDFDIPTYVKLKLHDGRVGWYKDKEGVFIGKVEETGGKINRYGHLSECAISFKNGDFFTGERDKDIIIGYLNKMHTREMNFYRYADLLSQVDLSMKMNIEKTRLNPIPIFRDAKIKDDLMKALDSIRDGEQKFYLYDTTIASLLTKEMGEGNSFDLLNLTDPKDADKIDYLSQFHDDLVSRICILYGINMVRDTKKAQVNNEELKGYCDLCKVNILNMLEEFKKEFEKVNNAFGTNLTVTLSKPWLWILEEETNEESEDNNDESGEEI